MLAFGQSYLIASLVVFGIVIARRYRSLPPRVLLNYTFSGLPRGAAWPRPLVWLPFAILVPVCTALLSFTANGIPNADKLGPIFIEIGTITLALCYLYDQMMQVSLGTRERLSRSASLGLLVAAVGSVVANTVLFGFH